MANGLFAGGNGTKQNPYLIEDAFDLDAVRNDLTAHYKLINDINLDIAPYNEGEGWIPIGGEFTGVLDGNGHIIENLFINLNGSASLFYTVKGLIKNIRVLNANVTGSSGWEHGIVAHWVDGGKIENCIVSGNIRGGTAVGGIAGLIRNNGIISCCASFANINGFKFFNDYSYSGGVVGWIHDTGGTVKNCYYAGRVVSRDVGGIADRGGSIINSFWDVEVSGTTRSAGGIGLTTAKMQTSQTFIDAGWADEKLEDGTPIWILKDGEYPKLWFEEDYNHLIKSNDKYYTYQNNEFIEVEPTVENFKEKSINLSLLATPTEKVILPMDGGDVLGNGRVFRKLIKTNKINNINILDK